MYGTSIMYKYVHVQECASEQHSTPINIFLTILLWTFT